MDEEVGQAHTAMEPVDFELDEMDPALASERTKVENNTAFQQQPISRSSSTLSIFDLSLADGAPKPLFNTSELGREKNSSLPRLRQFILFRILRRLWWDVFSIYRLIFLLVLVVNVYAAIHVIRRPRRLFGSIITYILDVSDVAAINFTIAVLSRQDYIINVMFWICRSIPHFMPLILRRTFAKVYAYGGLHSGAAFCATLWFSALSALVVREYYAGRILFPDIGIATGAAFFCIWAMLVTAYPRIRFNWHNIFEHVHRWAGWMCIIALWIQILYFKQYIRRKNGPGSPGGKLRHRIDFWCLLISTLHVIQPWVRLRRLRTEVDHLSSHTIRLQFTEKISNCRVYRIAASPLGEYHSFASIPAFNDKGASFLISDAGDWTRRTINAPRLYYWTRGTPTMGVLCMAQLFRKVVVITTGSGIGPCLGTLVGLSRKTKSRILWSAPSPRQTFGEEIYNAVLGVDPESVIIDTWADRQRPDLVQLGYELYVGSGAEAIFCISNRRLTRRLVFEMECRGIPAFGPIWDS